MWRFPVSHGLPNFKWVSGVDRSSSPYEDHQVFPMFDRIDAAYRSAEMRCTARIEDHAIGSFRADSMSLACMD